MNQPTLYQPSALPPGNETELVRSCLDYLNRIGHFCWRTNSGAVTAEYIDKGGARRKRFVRFNGAAGVSDILGVLRPSGRMLACEVKVGRNRPTEAQERFLALVESKGGLGIVIRSIEELIEKVGPSA